MRKLRLVCYTGVGMMLSLPMSGVLFGVPYQTLIGEVLAACGTALTLMVVLWDEQEGTP